MTLLFVCISRPFLFPLSHSLLRIDVFLEEKDSPSTYVDPGMILMAA